MPSWEEIVDRVVIGSNYYNVFDSANQWEEVFDGIDGVVDSLQTLSTESESWRGPAADGFREHLTRVIDDLRTLAADHRYIKDGLRTLGTALQTAVGSIEVPSWMYDDIANKQRAYHETGEAYLYSPGTFEHGYLEHVGGVLHYIPGWDSLEGWIRGREDRAQEAYQALAGTYGAEYASIPEGNPIQMSFSGDIPDISPGGAGPGIDPRSFSSPSGVGAPDIAAMTSPGVGDLPEYEEPPGTSLQGVTPGVPGGGLGAGGLGGGGLGAGGLGPGGLGAGGVGAGPGGLSAGGVPVAGLAGGVAAGAAGRGGGMRLPPMGPMVAPPVGGPIGAGAAGRGAGAAGGRGMAAGMIPGGTGGRPVGGEDERTTWLQEDEDVWGADTGAPRGTLGS